MLDSVFPFVFLGLIVGAFWLGLYCYLLYRLGRSIAQRYRTRPWHIFTTITLTSALLAALCSFIPVDWIWRSVIIFSVWITHTQSVGSGFWAGMELGKRADHEKFRRRTEEWLREWEHTAPHSSTDDAD
jgi:hypothetical protein